MNAHRTAKLLALVSIVALPACALAGPREQIARRYAAWDSAYRRRDVPAMGRILAPGFRLVTGSGKTIERAEYVASLRKSKPPKVYGTRLLRVAGRGATLQAFTQETSGAHVHRYRDLWRRDRGVWRMIESKTLDER